MSQSELFQRCGELIDKGQAFVLVTLVEATGSTPQDQGAKMMVTSDGLAFGTVGGGRVEAKALDMARGMLDDGPHCQLVDWNLKADVGMTCGGRVKLYFELLGVDTWPIVVFGAGHIAQAVVKLLVTLPCQVTCVDPRDEWLAKLPDAVRCVQLDEPADYVAHLPAEAYVLCMTKGHKSDLPVLQAMLSRGVDYPYIGVIGSRAKAAALRKELAAAGVPVEADVFRCPVGLPIGSNHPGEIAVSIAAQLLEVRDRAQAKEA